MVIGVDFDGVILDSERLIDYYVSHENWFNWKRKKDRSQIYYSNQLTYDWNDKEEESKCLAKCLIMGTKKAHFIYGAEEILNKLKEEGHQLILLTSRGECGKDYEITLAEKRLKKFHVKFDKKIYARGRNKGEVCKENNIDLLIDDLPKNCFNAVSYGVKALFFTSPRIKQINDESIPAVDDWMDVYVAIQDMKIVGEK